MVGLRLWPAMTVAALLAGVLSSPACAPSRAAPSADPGADAAAPPAQDRPYLWYAGAGLNAFTAMQTEQSGNEGAQYHVTPLAMQNFHDLAFDGQGNLWTIPFSGDQILRLPVPDLPPASNASGPDLVITGTALRSAQNLAFDGAGNLWVVSYDGAGPSIATISRFDDPSGLQGDVTLDASITMVPGPSPDEQRRFKQPSAIAFDGTGHLWLAATANVLRFDPPQGRGGDVALAPSAIIAGGDDAYAGLAFDAKGALWITGAGGGYFVERIDHPDSLSGTVSPNPDLRMSLPSQGGALFAGGMAFDAGGALWMATSNGLLKVKGTALTGSAPVTADVALATPAGPDLSSKLAFQGDGVSVAPSF